MVSHGNPVKIQLRVQSDKAQSVGMLMSNCEDCLLVIFTLIAPTKAGNKAINAQSKNVANPAMMAGILPKSCKLI